MMAFEIGAALNKLRSTYSEKQSGMFLADVESRYGWEKSSTYAYMAVGQRFADRPEALQAIGPRLPATALFRLCAPSVDAEVFDAVLAAAETRQSQCQRETESQQVVTQIVAERAVGLRRELDRLRQRLAHIAAAAEHWWRDRDSWQQQNDERIDDALFFAELAYRRKLELKRMALLAREEGELIGKLRLQIPVDSPPSDSVD
jgi:regulator of replication initiation timing